MLGSVREGTQAVWCELSVCSCDVGAVCSGRRAVYCEANRSTDHDATNTCAHHHCTYHDDAYTDADYYAAHSTPT